MRFPNITNVTLAFKIDYGGSKQNYRPGRILPVTAKIFEKLLSKLVIVHSYSVPSYWL